MSGAEFVLRPARAHAVLNDRTDAAFAFAEGMLAQMRGLPPVPLVRKPSGLWLAWGGDRMLDVPPLWWLVLDVERPDRFRVMPGSLFAARYVRIDDVAAYTAGVVVGELSACPFDGQPDTKRQAIGAVRSALRRFSREGLTG